MLGIVQPGFGSSSCCNIIMAYYYGVHTWFSGSWPPYMYPDYNLREVWNEGAHRNGIYIFRRPCINTPYIISIKISTSRVFVGYWGPDIRRVKRVERTARGWLQKKQKQHLVLIRLKQRNAYILWRNRSLLGDLLWQGRLEQRHIEGVVDVTILGGDDWVVDRLRSG